MSTRRKELKAIFDTGRYVVIVRSELFSKDGYFEVKAVDKLTRRYSFVNNMNGLIGELVKDDDIFYDTMFGETTWDGTVGQVREWFTQAKDLFSDSSYLAYFEKFLDDDRLAGEWGNQIK